MPVLDPDRTRLNDIRRFVARVALALVGVASAACDRADPAAERGVVTVSAASSLGNVVPRLGARFSQLNPGVELRYNFGASGTLAEQIRHGARADLFISAAHEPMTRLERDSMLVPGTRRVVASNALVLVAPATDTLVRGWSDLARSDRVARLALGTPASVPAGEYARQALRAQRLWTSVEPRVVYAQSARHVLTYVQRGDVDAGMVYRSDVLRVSGVRVVDEAPSGSHARVEYPAAVVAGTPAEGAARAFLEYLAGFEAQVLFREHGFDPSR